MEFLLVFVAASFISTGYVVCEENLDVTEGGEVVLPCRFNPSLLETDSTLYWIRSNRRNHDNVAIGQTAFHKQYRVDCDEEEGVYDLSVSMVEFGRDNGRFECRIKEDGTGVELYTKTISLTVLVPPPTPDISTSTLTAVEGRPYTLTCTSEGGSPTPNITWVRSSDREILDGNMTELLTEGAAGQLGGQNALTLRPSRADDGAQYTCQVWNRAMRRTEMKEKSINISVNYFPVVSVGPENPYRVELDHTAEMKCAVDAKPAAGSVKWEFSGRFIDTNFKHVIPQVQLQDGGSYFCSADNGLGRADKKELVLDVQYAPQVDITGQTEASEGETVTLTCKAAANPRPLGVSWFKKTDPDFSVEGPVLRLSNAAAKDGGEYVCSSYNYINPTGGPRMRRDGNSTVTVNIRHRPGRAVITPEEAIAVAGRSVTLVCSADPEGYPKPTYRWWREGRDGTVLSSESHYKMETVEQGSVGRYYCQPHNSLGQGDVGMVDLQVYLTPKLTSTPPKSLLKLEMASGLQISCSATAKPKPIVRWFKNGVEISSGNNELYKISITETGQNVLSTLSYVGSARTNSNQLTHKDKGHYSCQFENQVGRAEATMHLKIQHKPIQANMHNKVGFNIGEEGSVSCDMYAHPEPTFDWKLEEDRLESGVINYQSNLTKLGEDHYRSTLTISKVRSSSFGLYVCQASNTLGTARTQIRMMRKGPPEAPISLKEDEVTSESLKLSWSPGYNGGHKDTMYTVQYTRTADGQTNAYQCVTHNHCNITGLNQHTVYSLAVQASNEDGTSSWSPAIQVTTLVDVSKIPRPDSLVLERSTAAAHVKVPPTLLQLSVELELQNVAGEWVGHSLAAITDSYGRLPVDLDQLNVAALPVMDSAASSGPVPGPLRARLCLTTNATACGPYVEGMVVDTLDLGQPWLIALVVVVTLLGLVAVLIAIKCVCHSRRTSGLKGIPTGGPRATKILHPGSLAAPADAYKAQMFTIAGQNQHGTRPYDIQAHQIEQGSSQSDSQNSQEPLWAYQKSPSDTLDLHYPPAALAGYDNYPGYPYIDETPTDPDRFFHEQQQQHHLQQQQQHQQQQFDLQQQQYAQGQQFQDQNQFSDHAQNQFTDHSQNQFPGQAQTDQPASHRSSAVMSGEYSCTAAMENSGYSYQGLPDPTSYFIHSTSPNIFITEATADGLQTPNTRARRIVHEVIV